MEPWVLHWIFLVQTSYYSAATLAGKEAVILPLNGTNRRPTCCCCSTGACFNITTFLGGTGISNYINMMTLWNGNIFRVTGLLWGKSTGHWWIPLTKDQWRRALMFSLICTWTNDLSKQLRCRWFEMPLCSLWHHSNEWDGHETVFSSCVSTPRTLVRRHLFLLKGQPSRISTYRNADQLCIIETSWTSAL